MERPAVEVIGLRYSISGRSILDGVDLVAHRGQSIAVTGPSGTGKTTLLMCLAGILPVDAGQVRVCGHDFATLKAAARAGVRLREIGVVYQFGELLPELTPVENVALPALLSGLRRGSAYGKARELLTGLGVGSLAEAPTATLSGGERQRVAVARALVTGPTVVLADEPTGSLDKAGAEVVADLLFDLPKTYDCALIVVTHNDLVAQRAGSVHSLGAETGKLVVAS